MDSSPYYALRHHDNNDATPTDALQGVVGTIANYHLFPENNRRKQILLPATQLHVVFYILRENYSFYYYL